MKILLVQAKSNYPDPRPCLDIFGQGLPYLSSALKVAGHDVFGMNINYQWCHGSAQLTLETSLHESIDECQPDLIGIGGLSSDYLFLRDLIRFIRIIAPELPVVCGGGIVTYDQCYIFENLLPDYALVGDAEETFVKLVNCLDANSDLSTVENLAFMRDGIPIYTEVKYPVSSLDSLPFPDYEPFDLEGYFSIANQTDNYFYAHTRKNPRVMPLTLGRSCPYKCTFCCHQSGPKYRSRSIDNAVEEIIVNYQKYRFNILFIYDELFAVEKHRIEEFCDKVEKAKLDYLMDFDWSCVLRVNSVDKNVLEKMKSVGCIYVGYGLESASPKVLTSMKKGITLQQMVDAIEITEEAGLGIQGNFIFGDIAETSETIAETVDFYNTRCINHMINFGFVTPYPGSEIFDNCINKGLISDRQKYYENVGKFNRQSINMTTMTDDELQGLVSAVRAERSYPTVAAMGVRRLGIRDADHTAPFSERRSSFAVDILCPHCGKQSDYISLLKANRHRYMGEILQICPFCHRQFNILVSLEALPEDLNLLPCDDRKQVIALLQPFVPQLVDSYLGFNYVEYNDSVYAIPWFLGNIDLSMSGVREHPAIVSATSWTQLHRRLLVRLPQLIYYRISHFVTRLIQ